MFVRSPASETQTAIEISAEPVLAKDSHFATFPELRDQGRGFVSGGPGGSSAGRNEAKQSTAPRRRKRTMSAEARKRIGDGPTKALGGVEGDAGESTEPRASTGLGSSDRTRSFRTICAVSS